MRKLGTLLLLAALAAAEDVPTTLLWRHRLAERDHRWTARYDFWFVAMRDRAEAPLEAPRERYPAGRAVLHDGTVYLRDGLELVARRLASGRYVFFRGRYDVVPDHRYPVHNVRPRGERVHRFLDHAGNRVALGDGHIASVEGATLFAYALDSGKTRWGWDSDYAARVVRENADRHRRWQQDRKRHAAPRFLTAGLVVGHRYFTVGASREHQRILFWSMNVRTGETEYRVRLAPFTDNAPDLALAYHAGAVFIATNAGLVAAVDVKAPGRLLWGHPYQGKPGAFAFNDPILAGGRVIVAASDMTHVVAFAPRTGDVAWRVPRAGDWAHVVGVGNGVLVLAGEDVAALDAGSGAPRWIAKLQGRPFGRGFVDGNFAYVPSVLDESGQIERFDLKSGESAPPLKFKAKRLGNLTFADGRLLVVNGEEIACYGSLEAELKRATPLDRAVLLIRHGRRREAAAAFAAAESPYAKDLAFHYFPGDRFAYNDLTKAQVALAQRRADPELLDTDVVHDGKVVKLRQALEELGAK